MNVFDTLPAQLLHWRNEPGEWRYFSDRSLFMAAPKGCIWAIHPESEFTAPCLFHQVVDDFTAYTQLRLETRESGDAAFLIVVVDRQNWLQLKVHWEDSQRWFDCVVVRDGQFDISQAGPVTSGAPLLRVTRTSNAFTFSTSPSEGREWNVVRTCLLDWTTTVHVGVGIECTDGHTCEATFEYLMVD